MSKEDGMFKITKVKKQKLDEGKKRRRIQRVEGVDT
jgi:hypothetical protein